MPKSYGDAATSFRMEKRARMGKKRGGTWDTRSAQARPTSCSTTRLYSSVSSAHRRMRPAVSVSFLLRSCKAAFGGRHLSKPRICAVDSVNFAVTRRSLRHEFPLRTKEKQQENFEGRNFILHLAFNTRVQRILYPNNNSVILFFSIPVFSVNETYCNITYIIYYYYINSYNDNVLETVRDK